MNDINKRLLPALAILASLAGCGTPVPQRQAIETGIFDQTPPRSRAASVPAGPPVFLGVLLSRNTVESIRYMQRRYDVPHDGNIMMRGDYVEASKNVRDPDFPIRWIMKSLNERFGTVRVFDGMAELKTAQPDVIGLLDMEVQLLDWGQLTTFMNNTLRFYDSRGAFIADAAGRASRTYVANSVDTPAEIIALTYTGKLVLIEALDALVQSIDDVTAKPMPARTAAADTYDPCMRAAVRTSDPKLRVQAMSACDQAK